MFFGVLLRGIFVVIRTIKTEVRKFSQKSLFSTFGHITIIKGYEEIQQITQRRAENGLIRMYKNKKKRSEIYKTTTKR